MRELSIIFGAFSPSTSAYLPTRHHSCFTLSPQLLSHKTWPTPQPVFPLSCWTSGWWWFKWRQHFSWGYLYFNKNPWRLHIWSTESLWLNFKQWKATALDGDDGHWVHYTGHGTNTTLTLVQIHGYHDRTVINFHMPFLDWCGGKWKRQLVGALFGLGRKKIQYLGNLFILTFVCWGWESR